MHTYLLIASATEEARTTLAAHNATIVVLREQSPHLELVTLQHAISHGRHPETSAYCYTLDEESGDGICYWDPDPLSRQIHRWNAKTTRPVFTGLTDEQAQLRPRVAELCAHILSEQKMPWCNAWEVQQGRLDEWEAEILRVVLPLLPEDLYVQIHAALAHHQDLDQI